MESSLKVYISIFVSFLFLVSCANTNNDGVTMTFIAEGGIDIKRISVDTFEIDMYEHKVGSMDLYGINTMTPEERNWVASDVMNYKPQFGGDSYPLCLKPIEVLKESSFQVTEHPKRWLNTRWWKLTVRCSELNPKI